MGTSNQHIDTELIARYLAGEMSASEKEAFEATLEQSAELKDELAFYSTVWDAAEKSGPSLSDEINLDNAWKSIDDQITDDTASDSKPIKAIALSSGNRARMTWIGIAATVTALLLITATNWFLGRGNSLQHLKATTEMASVTLSDGTQISLAPGSSLEYPESFEADKRNVTLNGKGFFDVTRNTKAPFTVHTALGDVRVLGTAFEVDQTSGDVLHVEVEEGLVNVTSENQKLEAKVGAGQVCIMNPSSNQVVVNENDDPAAFFWKDKTIRFRRTELKEVILTLRNELNIEVVLESEAIEGCELTATFKDESSDTILDIIATTLSLKLEKRVNGYVLSGEGC